MRLWIMIAGPYSGGANTEPVRAGNLRALNEAAYEVWERGHVPVIGVNLALPVIEAAGASKFARIMMPLSLAFAERCDAVVRIGGHFLGADQEVGIIRKKGGRVFAKLDEIPTAS